MPRYLPAGLRDTASASKTPGSHSHRAAAPLSTPRHLPAASLPRSPVALESFGAAASSLAPSPEALDLLCPRFLFVDTHQCVHRGHHDSITHTSYRRLEADAYAFGRVTQTTFPSNLYETYSYDADNNLTSKTDRKGQTIQYVYDAVRKRIVRPNRGAAKMEMGKPPRSKFVVVIRSERFNSGINGSTPVRCNCFRDIVKSTIFRTAQNGALNYESAALTS